MKGIVVFIGIFVLCLDVTSGIKKELNPMKVNLVEFTEAMQLCGIMLGFNKDSAPNIFGSQEDLNRMLCLSFCALQKLKLYIIEDEIKKELARVRSAEHSKLKEQVYKALEVCKHRLDDPCRLFDCFFDYARKIEDQQESSLLARFFTKGSL